ncbi:hypothetical protein GCM10011418_31570 [Sphingobacterium alkalisoli]|nr:hypothetical protein GCM10011418_31570 [Sphingobacterium alkalisoli]
MTMKKYLYPVAYLFLLIGTGVLGSCSKEYETAPTPYTEITSFKIGYYNGQDTIAGIIDGSTIHIVWPGSTEWPIPETVNPEITVSRNATVSPASGASIPLEDGTTYTVTAQNGTAKTYTIKLINGALLPSFVDETAINVQVGAKYTINLFNTAGDGSDSLFLVNDNNEEFKVIHSAQVSVGGINFIADQPDGSGIPAGDYYAKVVNKYNVPVKSSTKMITVTEEPSVPYIYFNHTQTIEVKRGETFTVPIRHYGEQYSINRSRFYYIDPGTGYISFLTLNYMGANEAYNEVSFQVPADAPTGINLESDPGLQIRLTYQGSNLATNGTGYYPHNIKIVE